MTRTKRNNLVYGFNSLVSVFCLAWVIPTFTPPYPGYGVSSALLPNIVFSIILALSLLSLGTNIFIHYKVKSLISEEERPVEEEIPIEDRVHLGHLFAFMIPCVALFPVLQWIGFIPGALLFMLLMQYLCGQRKPLTMVIVAVCTTGVLYVAMVYGLKIPMP